jgi:hypothetical protein
MMLMAIRFAKCSLHAMLQEDVAELLGCIGVLIAQYSVQHDQTLFTVQERLLRSHCRSCVTPHSNFGRQKVLAIGHVNGSVQLMDSYQDQQPIVFDAGMHVSCIAWNPMGDVLLVAGMLVLKDTDSESNVLNFYTHTGQLLHQMRLPQAGQLQGAFMNQASFLVAAALHLILRAWLPRKLAPAYQTLLNWYILL